ncbi:MAG: PQQ-binding-like beta-propeller repeat protein [Deltaproteobacteria bacterium]|nr:PQQ-binding-like beta-propeller repeat protein [Deltaproteobacteria bacterium]MCB9787152.1 PQQ-binding-like beta-propeller repeat protein [Deltaproteobacteria bacterium]
MLILALASDHAAARTPSVGWRGDGTGSFSVPPHPGTLATLWTTPLRAAGNASPVVIGRRVFVTEEPTTLTCLDADTGKVSWRARNEYLDTLPPDEAAAVKVRLEEAERTEVELAAARKRIVALRRKLRRHVDAPEIAREMEELEAKSNAWKRSLDAVAAWRTADPIEIIGYGSSTPVVAEGRVYALFAQGVVSAFDLAGRRVWSRWLGPRSDDMVGYHRGHAASPVLAAGLLVVPFGALRGLDPATGEVRWSGETWQDFGTPAVVEVAGADYLVSPGGKLIRASDGAVVAEGLGKVQYSGAVVDGSTVYFFGQGSRDQGVRYLAAAAVRLHPGGGAGEVRVERLWDKQLPTTYDQYVNPLVDGGLIYGVNSRGRLRILSAETGELVHKTDLPLDKGEVFPSPARAGSEIWVGGPGGTLLALSRGPTPEITRRIELGTTFRASPFFVGARVVVRTLDAVVMLQAR